METVTQTPISDAQWQRFLDEYLDGGVPEPQQPEIRHRLSRFVTALGVVAFASVVLVASMGPINKNTMYATTPAAVATQRVYVETPIATLIPPTKQANGPLLSSMKPTARPTVTRTFSPTVEASPTPRPEPSYVLNGIDFSNQKVPMTMTITLRSGEVFSFTVKPQVKRNDFTPAQSAAFDRLNAPGKGTVEVYLDAEGHVLLGVHSGTLWPNDVPHDLEAEPIRENIEGGTHDRPQDIFTSAQIQANLARYAEASVTIAQGQITASFVMPGMVHTGKDDTAYARANYPQMFDRLVEKTGGADSPLAPYVEKNSAMLWFCGRDADVNNPDWFEATQYSGLLTAK